MASYTHDMIFHAFWERKGPVKRTNNPIWQGKNVFYDSDDQTIYSYSYNQPLAKWVGSRVIALDLDGKASPTTCQHSNQLRWNKPPHVTCKYVESVASRYRYDTHALDRWKSYNGSYHYQTFPDSEYYDSVLCPGNPQLLTISFRRETESETINIIDEHGGYYSVDRPYYVWCYGTEVRKRKCHYDASRK